uniref:Uncharacterized protein n=1 Tax=Panagrolaimus sp. PS1159 TaxID=55785 RepID=A0AC35FKU5_9BILA
MSSSHIYSATVAAIITFLLILSTEARPQYFEDFQVYYPQNVKRFNFNFLRTWQPLTKAEPLNGGILEGPINSFPSRNFEGDDEISANPKNRIRQKLMCIAAYQSTKACQDL